MNVWLFQKTGSGGCAFPLSLGSTAIGAVAPPPGAANASAEPPPNGTKANFSPLDAISSVIYFPL